MEISSHRIQSQSHQSLTPFLNTHNDKDQINHTNKVSDLAQMISTADPQGLINLGKIAIGDATVREWSDKGLKVDDQSFIAAAKALQEGFKAIVDALGKRLPVVKCQLISTRSLSITKALFLIGLLQNTTTIFSPYLITYSKKALSQGSYFFHRLIKAKTLVYKITKMYLTTAE